MLYRKEVVYDRKTGDFAMYINDEFVGYAADSRQAKTELDTLVYNLLTKGALPAVEQTPRTDYAAEQAA